MFRVHFGIKLTDCYTKLHNHISGFESWSVERNTKVLQLFPWLRKCVFSSGAKSTSDEWGLTKAVQIKPPFFSVAIWDTAGCFEGSKARGLEVNCLVQLGGCRVINHMTPKARAVNIFLFFLRSEVHGVPCRTEDDIHKRPWRMRNQKHSKV